jgi:hypothetical protein
MTMGPLARYRSGIPRIRLRHLIRFLTDQKLTQTILKQTQTLIPKIEMNSSYSAVHICSTAGSSVESNQIQTRSEIDRLRIASTRTQAVFD